MSMFDQPFRKHILDELKYRRDFHGVQTALHPHVRVTSLVGGNLGEFGSGVTEDLLGFTVGIPDLKQVNTISDYLNVSGQGDTAIGLTYPNYGGAKLVKLDSGKKLPPPGVTDVNISTQSKGGFIFKATINLKFYGKEQYDFIYQTMLRPGNPILIEYGQTRAAGSGGKDLGFFTELSYSRLQEYSANFRNNTQLKTTRNSGAVVGLVSNFAVRLNEQNEYEASIDLINALEYMFTLSPDDTFLDYGPGSQLAKSIQANFGIGEDEDWEPKDDKFFKYIIRDAFEGGEAGNRRTYYINDIDKPVGEGGVNYGTRVILPGEWTREYRMPLNEERVSGRDIKSNLTETLEYSTEDAADYLMVSLDYFLNKLLNKIINESYGESLAGFVSGQFVGPTTGTGNFVRVSSPQTRKVVLPPAGKKKSWRYCQILRSINPKKVIINNSNFYIGGRTFFKNARQRDYKEKYQPNEISHLFGINDDFEFKEQYTENSTIGGIFLNYLVIRSAFLSSNSVAEAIQKVLNTVNTSTSGILDLKMKLLPQSLQDTPEGETGTSQEFRITIYDEADSVHKSAQDMVEDLHTFFEDDVSEAISYDFDFSLPSSVAAGVMASTFQPQEYIAAGGQPKEKAFIDYGYAINSSGELAISSLLENLEPIQNTAVVEHIRREDFSDEERVSYRKDEAKALKDYQSTHETIEYGGALGDEPYSVPSPARAKIEKSGWWRPNDPPATRSYIDKQGNMWYSEGNIAMAVIIDDRTHEVTQRQYYSFDGSNVERDEDIEAQEKAWQNTNSDELEAKAAAARPKKATAEDAEEERLFRKLLGYKELMPAGMKASAMSNGLYTVFPSSAKITIKLQGLDGFRFGDLFLVNNILPRPYDSNSIFMLTGYEHTISSEGWFTEIGATLIASAPPGREAPGETYASYQESSGMSEEEVEEYENTQLGEIDS